MKNLHNAAGPIVTFTENQTKLRSIIRISFGQDYCSGRHLPLMAHTSGIRMIKLQVTFHENLL